MNAIRCKHCGDVIESLYRHDYKFCKCGKVSVDGGKDYLYAVAISDDGKIVAIGGEEGTIRIFNGTSGALVKAVTPPEDEKKEEKKEIKK